MCLYQPSESVIGSIGYFTVLHAIEGSLHLLYRRPVQYVALNLREEYLAKKSQAILLDNRYAKLIINFKDHKMSDYKV